MKKIVLCLIFMISLIPSIVSAKILGYNDYHELNIEHAFVVGDYIFDISRGFSPSLRDFMHASRTIPSNESVYVEEITIIEIPEIDYYEFSQLEIYSKRNITDVSKFKTLNPKYIYRANIENAKREDYTILN